MFFGFLFTLFTGLFFLIGILLLNTAKDKVKMANFSISLAFVVMFGLILFDLLPDVFKTHNILLLVPFIIGFLLLIMLDRLIPHHHHEHTDEICDKHDHELHLNHIGMITILALTIHNMIEGVTLYSLTLSSVKSGLLMMIGISLHNIPLGFQIGNGLEKKKNSYLLLLLLVFSSLIGALIIMIFGNLNELLIEILLSLTLGMLLYILMFELFGEMIKSIKKKDTIYGIIVGIIILIITLFI